MLQFPLILAEDTEDFIKFIFGALFVLIWIAGAITSAHKKKQREARERQLQWEQERQRQREKQPPSAGPPKLPQADAAQPSWQDIYRDLTGATVEQPRPTPRQAPPPLPAQQRPGRRKDRRGPRKRETPAPALSVAPPPPPSLAESSTSLIEGAIGSPEEKKPGRRTASDVLSSLNATTLRRQFIVTEILQSPLALRDERPR